MRNRNRSFPAQLRQDRLECERLVQDVQNQQKRGERFVFEAFARRLVTDVSVAFARRRGASEAREGGHVDEESMAALVDRFVELAQRLGKVSTEPQHCGGEGVSALSRDLVGQNLQLCGKFQEVEQQLRQLSSRYSDVADELEQQMAGSEASREEAQRADAELRRETKRMAETGWRKDAEVAELRGKIRTAERMVQAQQQHIERLKLRMKATPALTSKASRTEENCPVSSAQPLPSKQQQQRRQHQQHPQHPQHHDTVAAAAGEAAVGLLAAATEQALIRVLEPSVVTRKELE